MNGVRVNEEGTLINYLHMSVTSRRVRKIPRHLPMRDYYMFPKAFGTN